MGLTSLVAGIVAGCGIDDVGSFVLGTDASIDNTGPVLPPGTDGSFITDGGTGTDADADADADAPVALTCAASQCAAQGGSCEDGGNTCIIDCSNASACDGGVTCPPGVPCRVGCTRDNTCPKVDCNAATACDIACAGKATCETVSCAGTTCNVDCAGDNSCGEGGVTCTASASCGIGCAGGGKTCTGAVTCKSAACRVECEKDNSCLGGVTAYAANAQVFCDVDKSCLGGASCFGGPGSNCILACKGASCATTTFCCDAGTCLVEAGTNSCP